MTYAMRFVCAAACVLAAVGCGGGGEGPYTASGFGNSTGIGGGGGNCEDTAGSVSSSGAGGLDLDVCHEDSDCERYQCSVGACVDGFCQYAPKEWGSLGTTQIPGDCKVIVCFDGMAERIDDTDRPDDGDDCTIDACYNGKLAHVPAPAGSDCKTGPSCVTGKCSGEF